MHNNPGGSRIEIERKLLRALADSSSIAKLRSNIIERLNCHRFAEPDHEVIYRALIGIAGLQASTTKEALLQAVTRLGFPDIDVNFVFTGSAPSLEEIAELLTKI